MKTQECVEHLDKLLNAKVLNRQVLEAVRQARSLLLTRAILEREVQNAAKTETSRAPALSGWLLSILRDLPGATFTTNTDGGMKVVLEDGHSLHVTVEERCRNSD